jgi:hypothetical protein
MSAERSAQPVETTQQARHLELVEQPEQADLEAPEQPETTVGDAAVATRTVPARPRKSASRPQGPSEYGNSSGEIVIAEEKEVVLPEAAKPRVSQRSRGGASREARPSDNAELSQELARQERQQQLHLPSRFLEKAGVDADEFIRNAALLAMRRGGRDTSSLETKRGKATTGSKPVGAKTAGNGSGGGKEPETFSKVDRVEYSNGAQHLYATTSSGERTHISHDKVMEAYGYAGQTQGEREGLMGMYDEIVEQERSNGVKTLYGVDKDGKKRPLKYDAVLEYYGHRGDKQGTAEEVAEAEAIAAATTETAAYETEQTATGSRLTRALARAKSLLNTLQKKAIKANYATEEYLKDPTKRRRAIAGGVLGAAAVAVTATLLVKYGIHHGGSGTELSPPTKTHGGGKSGLTDQQILSRLSGNRKGANLSDQQILQQLTGNGHHKHLSNQQVLEQLPGNTPKSGAEYAIHQGDMPWDVLRRAGVPEGSIMHQINHAAKESGLDYSWHGSGEHRWIEVDGHSDTATVIKLLKSHF